MIKDIILNLERDKSRDSVRDYAISIAEAFDSHIAGVAFADGSGIPGFLTPDFPSQVLVGIIAEQEKAAREAVARLKWRPNGAFSRWSLGWLLRASLGRPVCFPRWPGTSI